MNKRPDKCFVGTFGFFTKGDVRMRAKRVLRIVLIVVLTLGVLTAAFATVLYVYSVEQNKTILVTHYTVSHEDIPASFKGKRIVQLTDLHNVDFGDRLAPLVAEQEPDIIVITGDWIGRYDTDITPALTQLSSLVGIAPIYYVSGNHEAYSDVYDELYAHLLDCGVTILEKDALLWTQGEDSVQILGMDDPEFSTHLWRDVAPNVEKDLYSILLFHRPEYLEEAAGYDIDLILAGHTHGGQIRLPLIGAVYAPNQGWFPKYDVGLFTCEGTSMIVSQGLGESTAMRILTPPEIVVVTLQ